MNQLFVTFFPYFCVLTLSAIALIFSERAGIINIGINGIMVMGATFYMIFANVLTKAMNPADKFDAINAGFQVLLFALAIAGGMLTC